MAPVVAYWNIRGLAEPIRYILHYQNADFEDKRYQSLESWLDEKFKLGLDFPNLPYFIDGDFRLSQSLAIIRHLARKFKLDGQTEVEKSRTEVVEQQLIDFRMQLVQTSNSSNFEKDKEELMKALPDRMKSWSTFLGNKKFLMGDTITYVDFMAYDIFDFYELFMPSVLKDFPNLKEYQKRFENLPQLQSYLKSSKYTKWPIFGPMASFGGKGDPPAKA